MISAGTIAAYLALDISEFNRNIDEARRYMLRLAESGEWGKKAMHLIGSSSLGAASILHNNFSSALNNSAVKMRSAANSMILSVSDASIKISEKSAATRNSLLSIGSCAPAVSASSQRIANAVRTPIRQLGNEAYGLMSNVGAGLNRGLAAKRSLIVGTARSIANSVTSTIRSVLRIASPSKVMEQIGQQTVQGLALGLNAGVPEIGSSAGALAKSITERQYQPVRGQASGGDISALAGRLDQLIALVSGGEQVMQVDGRVFARLIKEYS